MNSAINTRDLTLFREVKRHDSAICGNATSVQILQHKRRQSEGMIVGTIKVGGELHRIAKGFTNEHELLKVIGDVTEDLMRFFINSSDSSVIKTDVP